MSADKTDLILDVLAGVAETDEVRTNLELALYDLQILDSMKTVELIVALQREIGVDISPAEFEREAWATPAEAGRGRASPPRRVGMWKAWMETHPRSHVTLLTLYYLAVIAGLIVLYGRGDFSTPSFVYQGF